MRFDGEARRIDAGEREWDVAIAGIDAGATGGPVTVECRPVKPSNERVQRRRYLQQAVAPGAEQPTRFQRLSHLIEKRRRGKPVQCLRDDQQVELAAAKGQALRLGDETLYVRPTVARGKLLDAGIAGQHLAEVTPQRKAGLTVPGGQIQRIVGRLALTGEPGKSASG